MNFASCALRRTGWMLAPRRVIPTGRFRDLRAWLAEHHDLADDTPVILERDAEGNGYSPLAAIYPGWYRPEADYYGHAYSDDDAATPAQVAEDEAIRDAVEQGDLHQLDTGDVRRLVLGPVD